MLESGFIISCFGEDGIETTLEDDGVEEEARRAGVGAGHLYQFVLGAITQALGSVAHIPSEMVPVFASPEPAMSPLKKKPTPMHGWTMKYCARPPHPAPPPRAMPRGVHCTALLSVLRSSCCSFFLNCLRRLRHGRGLAAALAASGPAQRRAQSLRGAQLGEQSHACGRPPHTGLQLAYRVARSTREHPYHNSARDNVIVVVLHALQATSCTRRTRRTRRRRAFSLTTPPPRVRAPCPQRTARQALLACAACNGTLLAMSTPCGTFRGRDRRHAATDAAQHAQRIPQGGWRRRCDMSACPPTSALLLAPRPSRARASRHCDGRPRAKRTPYYDDDVYYDPTVLSFYTSLTFTRGHAWRVLGILARRDQPCT